jgi:signal transduction histidine kinase/CheY-like chemotaxis protein
MSLVVLADPSAFPLFVLANVSFLAIPVCFIVAIVGYGAFDLDRIVAATLAFAAALGVGLLVALGIAEPAARALARLVGTTDEAAHAGLLVALAFGVLPAARRLQPRFFASFFPARARMQSELDGVLDGFADCASERALADAMQAGLASLMSPSWQLAIAAPDAAGLRTVFDTRAGDADVLDETDLCGLLRATTPVRIERRGAPLQRRRPIEASAHDRLEAAGVAVAVPVHVPDQPSWAILLGRKETGDVFPANELELLGRVAGRVSLELMRIRAADLAVQNLAEREIHIARSKFLAATSHDLRQPLHSFGLHLGALATDDLTPKGRMLVGQLERSLGELQQQFESVLQVSKLDAGVVEPKVGPFALGPMIESLRASLEPVAASRGLSFDVPSTSVWVESDPLLLGRILRNLAENALRYTREGGVRIDVAPRRDRVRIAVRDTGPGIAPGDRDVIFAEFSRGRARESSGDAAPAGLGLGLSVVDRLARLLGHEVGLESTPGEGAAFRVEVPLAEAAWEPPPGDAATVPVVPSELAGAAIWVVDDETSVIEGLEALLHSWGCEVVTARSGGEALSKLETAARPPDVVIVDDQLGLESGTDVVDAFGDELEARGHPAPPEFVFVTGNTDPNRLAELSATGWTVLNKPVPVMRLRASLAHAMATRTKRDV